MGATVLIALKRKGSKVGGEPEKIYYTYYYLFVILYFPGGMYKLVYAMRHMVKVCSPATLHRTELASQLCVKAHSSWDYGRRFKFMWLTL